MTDSQNTKQIHREILPTASSELQNSVATALLGRCDHNKHVGQDVCRWMKQMVRALHLHRASMYQKFATSRPSPLGAVY